MFFIKLFQRFRMREKKQRHIICINNNNVFKKNIDENFNESGMDNRNDKCNKNNCVYNYLFS